MNILKDKEINDVRFSRAGNEWFYEIKVYGESFWGDGPTKERARAKAILRAERVLLPEMPYHVEI